MALSIDVVVTAYGRYDLTRLKAAIATGALEVQPLLIPERVDLAPAEIEVVTDHAETLAALNRFDSWSIDHVRREANADADALVNQALDAGGIAP